MPRLFVDKLTVIDCSILDPERGLIGASWSVDIELLGELDHQSMVFDFSKVKKTIKQVIDKEVDHKLLVPQNFSGTAVEKLSSKPQDSLKIIFTDRRSEVIEHQSPSEAVCLIATQRVSRAAVIDYLTDIILKALPENVQQLLIHLNEEDAPGNYYCYSHGLKKHDGNCQRIAHGHRSQIQIWQNDQRSEALERSLANKWQDIYLATQEDLVTQENGRLQFSYTTDQGLFNISLAQHRVHLMDCDSTVECIAEHLVELVKGQSDQHTKIKVKAFEGIGKGAIAASK